MTDRMVRDYNSKCYQPARDHYQRLAADEFAGARALAEWKVHVLRHWDKVAIESAEVDQEALLGLRVGSEVEVGVTVRLGELKPEDVLVEIFAGRLDEFRRIRGGSSTVMEVSDTLGVGLYRYRGVARCTTAGRMGFGIRAVPSHPDLAAKYEMGKILWA